jgi:hypothetical protein
VLQHNNPLLTSQIDEREVENAIGTFNLMPEFVVSLESSDDFLRDRVMNIPQSQIVQGHNDEAGTKLSPFCFGSQLLSWFFRFYSPTGKLPHS